MKTTQNLFSILATTLLFLLSQPVLAQQSALTDTVPASPPTYWTTGGSLGFNFSQVRLSNWAGGGQSSIAVNSIVNLFADYARGNSIWENRIDLAYGLMRQGDDRNADFRKTDDILNFISRYNYNIQEGFYITALTDFRTQMDVGYEFATENGETRRTKISDLMAPGFLVSSIGATFKKGKLYSITLSPLTSKLTFVLDDRLSQAGEFGVEPGRRVRSEIGAAFRSAYEQEILTNINFRTNLSLFANYQTFTRVDVNWEGILLMKVNNYITSTISAQLIYDHDIIQKTQWRNSINVGFLYEL